MEKKKKKKPRQIKEWTKKKKIYVSHASIVDRKGKSLPRAQGFVNRSIGSDILSHFPLPSVNLESRSYVGNSWPTFYTKSELLYVTSYVSYYVRAPL